MSKLKRAACVVFALMMVFCTVSCSAADNENVAYTSPSGSTDAVAAGSEKSISVGDVNGDGNLNARDVITLMRSIIGWQDEDFIPDAADVSGDGKTNARDVIALMKRIVSGEVDVTPDDGETNDTLVVYFSCSGTTKGIAEKIAAATGAKLIEITAAEPYSAADRNYNDSESRTSKEQNDPDVRPAIANEISLDGCRTLYLGYPIWWGQAPRILSTFVEGRDFIGITVVPFCTSGSSDIGQSDDTLAGLAGSGNWLQGKRFAANASNKDVEAWITGLGLETSKETTDMKIMITVGDRTRIATLSDNASAAAFYELLKNGVVTVEMSDYGGFEKVGALGTSIVRSDERITTTPGDIILYQGNQVTIYYDVNTWNFTLLGHVDGADGENMREFLGEGDVTVVFSVE